MSSSNDKFTICIYAYVNKSKSKNSQNYTVFANHTVNFRFISVYYMIKNIIVLIQLYRSLLVISLSHYNVSTITSFGIINLFSYGYNYSVLV